MLKCSCQNKKGECNDKSECRRTRRKTGKFDL